jgi:alkylation response protein AidB-like acyl-CoA dehydrogenase
MDMFDKDMSREKRDALELAEASRESQWSYPSFVREIFHGSLPWDLIFPFPMQSEADKKIGDDYVKIVEDFLQKNLNPDEVDKNGEIPDNVIKGLIDLGAFAMKIPKEYGGLGLSQVNYNRVIHMIASYCGSTAVVLSAHQSIGVPYPLTLFGTPEQKDKYLPRFRKGAISGFALTEPSVGSDPHTMKTTATPTEDGKSYLLNGEKLWISNGNIADILIVMALTPPKIERGKEKKQITAFIVETNTPGFEAAYRCSFMGLHGVKLGLLKFNNLKVPAENLLGGEGQGLKIAFVTLNTGRLTVPAAVTGMSKWCLNVSRNWSKERIQWGAPIGEHQGVATKLSLMAANTFALDAVTWLTSHMADAKKLDIRLEAAIAKLFCTETSWQIIDDTLQIRGGRGFETSLSLKGRGEKGCAVERVFRDCRVNLIIEGTSQIMRLFIAREALDPHLKRIMAILSSKVSILNKIKAAISTGWFYFLWWIKLCLPVFACGNTAGLPKPLNKHMLFVRSASKRLAKVIFIKMMIYQQRLESRQNILNRFVDIGTDLFAMCAACSYAASLLKQKGLHSDASPVELADLFCLQAKTRIARNFKDLWRNNDKTIRAVGKKLMAGGYAWLENEIIK